MKRMSRGEGRGARAGNARRALLAFAFCLLPFDFADAADFEEATHAGIVFVRIPAGSFTMGTDDKAKEELAKEKAWSRLLECERPARVVAIAKPFLIGKFEVTQKQWRDVMGANPSAFKGDTLPVDSVSWDDIMGTPARGNQPAKQGFLDKINAKGAGKFRLPTEAEWEYCCRAGGTGLYSLPKDRSPVTTENLGDFAWFRANAKGATHPFGEKKPNAWGLHDVHGNVWEWCQDFYAADFYAKAANSLVNTNATTERVFRGGSWFLDSNAQRAAMRGGNVPGFKSQYVGFRLVREP